MGWRGPSRVSLGAMAAGVLIVAASIGAQPARAFPPDQVSRGEGVWNRICSECHGPDSTNVDAPLLLRPDSLRRFPNAAAAHKYVSESMPNETPGSLAQEEYWDVIAYLLASYGVGEGDAPLGPETAANVPTRAGGTRGAPAAKPAGEPAAKPSGDPAAQPEGEAEGEGTPAP
ncbi:MAG: c-type cytochrome [Chloroflexi bacterium]|nr:c-type cytochrome [Chloroflexota bacterium]